MEALNPRWKLLQTYYLATPLFVLADAAWGLNVRVAGLEGHPGWKYAYYALCLVSGVLTIARPHLASMVGLAESAGNLCLLIVGVWLSYYGMVDAILTGQPVTNPFTPERITNLLFSGIVFGVSYHRNPLWHQARERLP